MRSDEYEFMIERQKDDELIMIKINWEWKFDDLWNTLDMKENERLWYKVNKTKKILSDEMKYENFVRRIRKKSTVNVTCKKREIREE